MSNAIQRIMNHAIVFTLLISVSLISYANDIENYADSITPPAHFIACDAADPAKLDTEQDNHTATFIADVAQPLPDIAVGTYAQFCSKAAVYRAQQRGPPTFN